MLMELGIILGMMKKIGRVTHRCNVDQVAKETTQTGISAAESRYGIRYSVLLALPYFNAVRFTVVDVMHNLFLGTAKRICSNYG